MKDKHRAQINVDSINHLVRTFYHLAYMDVLRL